MGYRIKQVRESKGMSQTELAEKSGITRATIWKLETDDTAVTTTDTLAKIAQALGVGVSSVTRAAERAKKTLKKFL